MASVASIGDARFIPEMFRRDREVMLAAVQHKWHALHHAPDFLRDDFEAMLCAARQAGQVSAYVCQSLGRARVRACVFVE